MVSVLWQLAEVVESLNEELKELEGSGSDVTCVNELWLRYTQKINVK